MPPPTASDSKQRVNTEFIKFIKHVHIQALFAFSVARRTFSVSVCCMYSFGLLWNVDENSFVLRICLIFCSESEWVWHLISLLTILNYICWLMYEHNEWMQGRSPNSALYEFEVLWMDLNGVSLLTTNSFRSSSTMEPGIHLKLLGKISNSKVWPKI